MIYLACTCLVWVVFSVFCGQYFLIPCCLFLVLRQNACEEANTWTFIIHGLGGSHDQQAEGTAGLSHTQTCVQMFTDVTHPS